MGVDVGEVEAERVVTRVMAGGKAPQPFGGSLSNLQPCRRRERTGLQPSTGLGRPE